MAAGRILIGHGGGGLMTKELVTELFQPYLDDEALLAGDDAAVLEPARCRPAFTIDAFTVTPLFFAGGDLGCLAVYGTVNDLAVCGAAPCYLSLAWVLEEGLSKEVLSRLVGSVAAAAKRAQIRVVAADTKVVERGRGDGVYLIAAGIGYVDDRLDLGLAAIEPGDALIVSGPVGDHGTAVLLARSDLDFSPPVASDCQPLAEMLGRLHRFSGLRFMRDPTRGGLAAALKEIAEGSGRDIWLEEEAVPIRPAVRAAAEILGLDPFNLACEGRSVIVIAADQADEALQILRRTPEGTEAAVIGRAAVGTGQVYLSTAYGGTRILDRPVGDDLPRIC